MKLVVKAIVLVLLMTLPVVAQAQAPTLTITEATYGPWIFVGLGVPVPFDTPSDGSGATLTFAWSATPGGGTTITDYRYGWDLLDPNDGADPGWSAWGAAQAAPSQTFFAGTHTFVVEARNDLSVVTRGGLAVTVVPGPVPTTENTWGAIKALFR